MKKLLFGIISISTLAFAAQPTLTDDPTENTNVFQTGQFGQIAVKGNLSSDVPKLKYVVYSSVDGTYDGTTGEIWQLPEFTTFATTSSPGDNAIGFCGQVAPKLYVKKVNSANDNVIDLTTEKVAFKLQLDPSWSSMITGSSASLTQDFQENVSGYWNFK